VLREVLADVLEVVQHESVPVCPPPVGDDPLGQHDHVALLLFTVHEEEAENGSPRAWASSHLFSASI
jgi:hypothetical protein